MQIKFNNNVILAKLIYFFLLVAPEDEEDDAGDELPEGAVALISKSVSESTKGGVKTTKITRKFKMEDGSIQTSIETITG